MLDKKIEQAKEIIREALKKARENNLTPLISHSGGIDSVVLYHLVKSVDEDVGAVFF